MAEGTRVADETEDPRQLFGELVRKRREDHDPTLSQAALAKLVNASQSTLSRVERGEGPIPPEMPALLDKKLCTDGEFRRLYDNVVSSSFPAIYRRARRVEREAIGVQEWSPTLVPGLLQTRAYARELIQCGDPFATEEEVNTHVEARLARQKVMDSDTPPDVRVVLCQSVIERQVGDAEVMRGQLKALLEHAERPTVRLQILPLDAPAHTLMSWPLTILTQPNHVPVVSVEAYRSARLIDDVADVRAALRAYDAVTSEAHSARDSARLITEQIRKLS